MPIVKTRTCPSGHAYDVLKWADGSAMPQSNPTPDDDSLDCPTCGAIEFTEMLGVGQGINLNKGGPVSYPYWDETLGAQVESHAHMLRLAAAKGLRPMESRDSISQSHRSEAERAWHKSADEGKAFAERQQNEPWYREMADKIGVKVRDRRTGEVSTVFRKQDVQEFTRAKRPREG